MKFCIAAVLTAFLSSALFAETFVYVSESKDRKIATYRFDEASGKLTRQSDIELSGTVGPLWHSADKTKLYASVRSTKEFATLEINPENGSLKLIGTAPSAGSSPYIYPDKTERFLLAAYYGDGLVSVSKISDGIVSGEPIQVVKTGKKAHCIQTSPDNRFAFVPHPVEQNKVHQFKFDEATGKLTDNVPEKMEGAEGAGPRHIQFHPNGKWAYVVNEQGKSVTHCLYDAANGTLKMMGTVSTLPPGYTEEGGSCADIEISSDGNLIYASNRGHNSIARMRIDPKSGEVKWLDCTPAGEIPRSFNLMPGEAWLVAAGQKSNELVVYERDSDTGVLSETSRISCGLSPSWVVGISLDQ